MERDGPARRQAERKRRAERGSRAATESFSRVAAIELAPHEILVNCVSPGLIEGQTAQGPIPLLPGIATASELMAGLSRGFTRFKLFPANVAGGLEALKAFSSPFPQAKFCPTGGVSAKNAADYLALPNVVCVGGSWVAPADAVKAGDWGRITAPAREACALAKA